eukprot:8033461-Pyramimonas_sp.AAC.1
MMTLTALSCPSGDSQYVTGHEWAGQRSPASPPPVLLDIRLYPPCHLHMGARVLCCPRAHPA